MTLVTKWGHPILLSLFQLNSDSSHSDKHVAPVTYLYMSLVRSVLLWNAEVCSYLIFYILIISPIMPYNALKIHTKHVIWSSHFSGWDILYFRKVYGKDVLSYVYCIYFFNFRISQSPIPRVCLNFKGFCTPGCLFLK